MMQTMAKSSLEESKMGIIQFLAKLAAISGMPVVINASGFGFIE